MAASSRRTAVELAEWMDGLTVEQIAAMRDRVPISYLDQMQAAREQTVGAVSSVAHRPAEQVPHDQVPDWIRMEMLDTFLAWCRDEATVCSHDPSVLRPQPVFACAWKPGLVVCRFCVGMLKAVGVADTVCDRCGRICNGPAVGEPIATITTILGGFAYQVGVCWDCHPDHEKSQPKGT